MAGFLKFPEEALAEAHGLDGSLWLSGGEHSSFLPRAGTGPGGASAGSRSTSVSRVVLTSAAARGHIQRLEPHYQEQAKQDVHTPFWTLGYYVISPGTLRSAHPITQHKPRPGRLT